MNTAVQGGWVTIGEARKVVGLEADERHDVYLRPLNMIQVTEDGSPLLNDQPTNEPAPANNNDDEEPATETDESKLTTIDLPPEVEREDVVKPTPTYLNEEKYIAEMPNGAFCVISHEDGEIIKCFDTRAEAENFLNNKKEPAALMKDTYTTIEEAQERAKELGCEGTHYIEVDGDKFYMACATHQDYLDAVYKPKKRRRYRRT